MTISTQQLEITLVRLPVLESAGPIILSFVWDHLLSPIKVVNRQHSNIRVAAVGTPAAKFFNQGELAPPVARQFVLSVSLSIPVVLLASRGAKLCVGWLAALVAFARMAPSGLHVAFHRTVFVLVQSARSLVGLELVSACFAFVSSHVSSIAIHGQRVKPIYLDPGYFQIAVDRIQKELDQRDSTAPLMKAQERLI